MKTVRKKSYQALLKTKDRVDTMYGFAPTWIPKKAFDFQAHLGDWAIRKGRTALYEDCGLGKTLQELIFAENCVRHTNRPALILTPLAVSQQTIREADKFGIKAKRTRNGKVFRGINVTNYERLKYYDPKDFSAVVCDESSILKNFDGKLRRLITDFMLQVPYRLLATATPAPNDFMELGTSSEALGVMTYAQMLGMFFTNGGETTNQWVLKQHGKKPFWRWMASWSRAIRTPADCGFDASRFVLPKLIYEQHVLASKNRGRGFFPEPARTLKEQLDERRQTITERCEKVASIISQDTPVVCWCHRNDEGNLLENLIPDAIQVAGSDKDEDKEEKLIAFAEGQARVLITKPKIACFGLNWQHCHEVTVFPSHSFEQFYQLIRRCYRFGQEHDVLVRIVTTQREVLVMKNLKRKERQADEMFNGLVAEMRDYQIGSNKEDYITAKTRLPKWL